MAIIFHESFDKSQRRSGTLHLRKSEPTDRAISRMEDGSYTVYLVGPASRDDGLWIVAYTVEQVMGVNGAHFKGLVCVDLPTEALAQAGAPKGTYLADCQSPANVWLEDKGFWFAPLVLQEGM